MLQIGNYITISAVTLMCIVIFVIKVLAWFFLIGSLLSSFVFFFFFFQAEDGIRDVAVTGVQTCALPISPLPWPYPSRRTRPPDTPDSARRGPPVRRAGGAPGPARPSRRKPSRDGA